LNEFKLIPHPVSSLWHNPYFILPMSTMQVICLQSEALYQLVDMTPDLHCSI